VFFFAFERKDTKNSSTGFLAKSPKEKRFDGRREAEKP